MLIFADWSIEQFLKNHPALSGKLLTWWLILFIILFFRSCQRTKVMWKHCSGEEKLNLNLARQNQPGRISWKRRSTPQKTRRSIGSSGCSRNKTKLCTKSRRSSTRVSLGQGLKWNQRRQTSSLFSGSGWCPWFVIWLGCSNVRMSRELYQN